MAETERNAENEVTGAPDSGSAEVAAGASADLQTQLAQKDAQLAQAQAQAAEYLDNWRRAVAELSNARKRMARELEEGRITAAERVLERLLPIADDIDRAIGSVPADLADSEWVNGFRLIQRKLQALLENEGVKPVPAAGEMFDPALHYAVTHEEADGFEEGAVIEEVARGYKLGERVLRPSMVRVAKGKTQK
jgi:molecular chaperone GrpE